MKKVYGGLDVHSKQTVYVLQDEAGQVLAEGAVRTERVSLEEWLRRHALADCAVVCLESGGQAAFVCDVLRAGRVQAVVVDAAEVRRKARRRGQKTDRRDAFELCDGLRRDQWQARIYIPPAPIRALRQILSRRRHFVRLSTQQINAAKYLLRREARLVTERVSLTTAAGWARLLAQPTVAELRAHLQLHAQTWELAQAQIAFLEAELAQAVAPVQAVVAQLQTVPGIGPVTAATYVAVLGDPTRFPDSNHVVSYLGLAPTMWDSGETERHGRITKAGSSPLRALLCEVAQHASRPVHPLHPYFVRVAARHGYKKAAIAIAQRLARILYRLWRDGTPFDPGRLNVEPETRPRIKRVCWRIKPPVAA